MINTKFEVYKIKRELRRSGKVFEFYRKALNDFGELQEKARISKFLWYLFNLI